MDEPTPHHVQGSDLHDQGMALRNSEGSEGSNEDDDTGSPPTEEPRKVGRPKGKAFVFHDISTDWMQYAECAGTAPKTRYDDDIFFPEQSQTAELAPIAKSICSGCLVRQECRDYQVASGSMYGIWGGETAQRRKRKGKAG